MEHINKCIKAVEDSYDADLFLLAGGIFRPKCQYFADVLKRPGIKSHKNAILMLSTYGGDADVAYRIARCFQRIYNTPIVSDDQRDKTDDNGKFYVYFNSACKSAGTLIALGATELIASEGAELGPIDAQIRKVDEPGERTSGLVTGGAFNALQVQATEMFSEIFTQLRYSPQYAFSSRLAAEIANDLTTGLLSPVYAQIDPVRVAELERSLEVGAAYAERLDTGNLNEGAIGKLLAGYPSHGFVIDIDEVKELFKRVKEPSEELEFLGKLFILDAQEKETCFPIKVINQTGEEEKENVRKDKKGNPTSSERGKAETRKDTENESAD